MTPIFRWNGEYFGFIKNDRLFNAYSKYIGWITDDGRVWRNNGVFLGEIEKKNYILKRISMVRPVNKVPKVPPVPPIPPTPRTNRVPKTIKPGYVDALDDF